MKYELVIKNGTIVTEQGETANDIAVSGGKIAGLGARGKFRGAREIDAEGMLVLPGGIDTHVHFNEPGMSEWEDWRHGSAAAAAGGVTTVVDMPVDNVPPTIDAQTFLSKKEVAVSKSLVDFCLWGGLTRDSLPTLHEMSDCGAVGWKAFMAADCSGPYFPPADDATLYEGMRIAAKIGLPVALHCENAAMIDFYTRQYRSGGKFDNAAWSKVRPLIGELEAVNRVLYFALLTGARINIAHISAPEVAGFASEAKKTGLSVTVETCAHYLLFNEDDVMDRGSILKCAPPIRGKDAQDGLWENIKNGGVDFVASDHSPVSADLKARHADDMDRASSGVSGVQFPLNVLFSEGVRKRDLSLSRLTSVFSANAARMLGIYGTKGAIAEDFDADFVLFDPGEVWTVTEDDYKAKVKISPYIGETFTGRVTATYVRGVCVHGKDREDVKKGFAKMLRPLDERRAGSAAKPREGL